MRCVNRIPLILIFVLVFSVQLHAQISGNNLMEYQFGKLPGDSAAFSSVYDRAVVNYNYNRFKVAFTLEQFHTPFEERNYLDLTQYSLHYNSDPIEVKLGNFYETIGRGLLLRSYEIPGAILEDLSYRSRHYFHRDILGFSTKVRHKNFSAKLLYGRPLNYAFPPVQDDKERRPDIVEAIYSDYLFGKQTLGASVLRLSNDSKNEIFAMVTVSGSLFSFMTYYTEFAKNISDYTLTDHSVQAPYAYYGSINLSFNRLGISTEYKTYNNFLIGAGINEPPALVKEHSYKVLNRSTHVLQPLNEQGYQVELFYMFPDFSVLTLNNTLAVNDFGKQFVFQEYFMEYSFTLFDKPDIKIFADYAEDPFKLEEQRISAGTYVEWKIFKHSLLNTNYEFQSFNRLDDKVQNHIVALGYAYKSKFIVNFIGELSNDRFLVNKNYKAWLGANLKYQINKENSLQIFAGQRRGGPACNAGVCYEVLDFNGVKLRLVSRF